MTNSELELMLSYRLREKRLTKKINQPHLTNRQQEERPKKRRAPRFRRYFDPDKEC